MPRKPAFEVRYGFIVVRVWQQKRRQDQRFVVTSSRLFRNGSDWKESSRFSANDLPFVRHALDKAHNWILQQEAVNS